MSKSILFSERIERTITSDDILGKSVIDSSGKTIGLVEKVLIDPKTLDFVGVEIDKGLLKKGVLIGKNYIKSIEEHAVFLKIRVTFEMKGMTVFDKDGKRVGIISRVELVGKSNKLKAIHVARGLLRHEALIPGTFISSVGQNVILTVRNQDIPSIVKKH